jgi:hypothetical protein
VHERAQLPDRRGRHGADHALPIAGKIRQQLSRALLLRLAAAIARQLSAAGTRAGKLDDLPFDAHRIQVMKRLVSARMRHLQPG